MTTKSPIPAHWVFRDRHTRLFYIAQWAKANGYRLTTRHRFRLFLEPL